MRDTLFQSYNFMATITYLYRSQREKSHLKLRLLFSFEGKAYTLSGNTKIEVTKDYWYKVHKSKKLVNIDAEVSKDMNNLSNYVLDRFNEVRGVVTKEWLHNVIEVFYNPRPEIPIHLVDYVDYFLRMREGDLSESAKKKYKVIQNLLIRFQDWLKLGELKISDVNEEFKNNFVRYAKEKKYAENTAQRHLNFIKTICFHARYMGVSTHHQLDKLSLPKKDVTHIYLTPRELQLIKESYLPHNYLENARDWLLISCYTGQRVSDFLTFDKKMIKENGEIRLLEFRQQKTKKLMAIPILKEVEEILEKRNGEFPRKISSQKYNDYIKIVCKHAGLNMRCTGKKRVCIAPKGRKPLKTDYRDVLGEFEKWELVTSHIGRRSFATNFYGKVPTSHLRSITGHSSEAMFLNYIKKGRREMAIDSYQYFSKL